MIPVSGGGNALPFSIATAGIPADQQRAKTKETERAGLGDGLAGELNIIQVTTAKEAQLSSLSSKRRDIGAK